MLEQSEASLPPLVHRVWSFYIICSRPPSSSSFFFFVFFFFLLLLLFFFFFFFAFVEPRLLGLWSVDCVRSSSRIITLRQF